MKIINKRLTGGSYELTAADYLKRKGLDILLMNYRCKIGEIDIVAKENNTYVFVEVKYRKNDSKGDASEAVDIRKQKKICKVSDYFRMVNRLSEDTSVRYDVVAINGEKTEWYKNAFEYIY